ncbi:TetR/AcrR family transcriptional regulator [Aquihabitans sp. G128]|uniref:TetR/AcrR family transcriptional regulator n=1 Tax=Aquihabitans sp. G128 TaxID=2849779 RepID=UPI001C230B36|nr:TetR/AcrR family transcriptional regulator [Aquihabitans sp. G128]QXC62877.1 TetR/AcrR family transcriptional regulator [Aquihabitans sp. G128]
MARTPDPAVRVALLEAAAQLLADEGLDALSLRKVAGQVGASTMAVYTHFGGKDELVAEVVKEAFRRLHVELTSVPRTDDVLADLVATGVAYRRNALANAPLYRVMFGLNPLALTDPAAHQGETDVHIGLDAFGVLVGAVARAVEAGALHGEPPQLALAFWAAAHGAVSLELAGFLGEAGQATFDAATGAVFLAATRA